MTCLAAQETPQGHVGHRLYFFVHGRLNFEWLSSDVMGTNGAGNYPFPATWSLTGYSGTPDGMLVLVGCVDERYERELLDNDVI